MNRSDLFMSAVYAAIADEAVPVIGGFGNGIDYKGNDFIDEVVSRYPVLQEYMDGRKSTHDAFNRYTCFMRNWNYEDYVSGKTV